LKNSRDALLLDGAEEEWLLIAGEVTALEECECDEPVPIPLLGEYESWWNLKFPTYTLRS